MRRIPFAIGAEDAVGGRGAQGEELIAHRVGERQMTMPFEHRDQFRQEGHEALGTNAIGGRPGDDQCILHGGGIESLTRSGQWQGYGNGMREEPDGVLAGIAGDGDKLVEDDGLLLWRRAPIARGDACEQFAFGQETHRSTHPSSLRVVVDQLRRVTLLVRQEPAQSVISREAIRTLTTVSCRIAMLLVLCH
ncbi:MAG: hypothetical protein NVS4B3_28120 [Gemmatimonadaceae bacterium]